MAETVEKYRNVIITPEAAEHLADWLEQYVQVANTRYPRNRAYTLMRNMRYGDTGPSFLAVSDRTDNYVVYISLNPVTDIIETQEGLYSRQLVMLAMFLVFCFMAALQSLIGC